jgi:hypothetical protein
MMPVLPPRRISFVAKGRSVTFVVGRPKAKAVKAKRAKARWDTPEHRAWSGKVKDRCGNRCVVCGSSRSLRAHHLMSWADNIEHRFDLDNGVAVCRRHHDKFHNQYGRGKNTATQFVEFQSLERAVGK